MESMPYYATALPSKVALRFVSTLITFYIWLNLCRGFLLASFDGRSCLFLRITATWVTLVAVSVPSKIFVMKNKSLESLMVNNQAITLSRFVWQHVCSRSFTWCVSARRRQSNNMCHLLSSYSNTVKLDFNETCRHFTSSRYSPPLPT